MLRGSWAARSGSGLLLPRPTSLSGCQRLSQISRRYASLTSIIQGQRRGDEAIKKRDPPSSGRHGRGNSRNDRGRRSKRSDAPDGGERTDAFFGSGWYRTVPKTKRSDPSGWRDRPPSERTVKAFEGAASERQRQKLSRKLERKAEEEEEEGEKSGRQTRRSRFLDPKSSFGKKSLVYLVKQQGLTGDAVGEQSREDVTAAAAEPPFDRGTQQRTDAFSARREDSGGRRDPARSSFGRHDTKRLFDGQRADKRLPRNRFDGGGRVDRRPSWERLDDGKEVNNQRFGKRRDDDGETNRRPSTRGQADGFSHQSSGVPNNRQYTKDLMDADSLSLSHRTQAPRPRKSGITEIVKLSSASSVFVYGRSSVLRALTNVRRRPFVLYLGMSEDDMDTNDVAVKNAAKQRRTRIKWLGPGERHFLDKWSEGRPHNGFVLETAPLPQPPLLSLGPLEESPHKFGFRVVLGHQSMEEAKINGTDTFVRRRDHITPKPFVLLLDKILDPGNLGALLRSARYFGIDAVAISARGSAGLMPTVLKAASGACEEAVLFSVSDTTEFVKQSKEAGWETYAAVAPPSRKLQMLHGEKFISEHTIERNHPLRHKPCLLVLGNEGEGLPRSLREAVDWEVTIPKVGKHSTLESLNVSVAGALLCHSFVKGSSAARVELRLARRRERTKAELEGGQDKANKEGAEDDEGEDAGPETDSELEPEREPEPELERIF